MKKNIKIISATFIAMMLVISACKNDDVIIISKDLTVNFDQNSYNLPENGDPVVATLISKESYADKTIEIKVEGSAVYGTDYTTVPEVVDGVMTIEVAKGQSEYTVTISPIDNFIVNDERNMTFTLQSTDEIEAGDESTLTVTMSDDEVPGLTELFEDFEGGTVNDPVAGVNWINYAEAGTRTYVYKSFSGNQFGEFNPFSSGEDENVGWLVTPRIAMDEVAFKEMSLWSQRRFRDGEQLSILYSSDFTGISTDITTATWTSLPYTAPSVNDTWIETGAIDLSALSGDVFFAFKYVGSGNNNTLDGTWRIDNLRIGLETPDLTIPSSIADFGSVNNGESSGETSFQITSAGISGNVTITAPSNFEVSLTSGTGFTNEVVLDASSTQTVYVRFVPNTGINNVVTGDLTLSAAEITGRTISVSGTEAGNIPPLFFEDFESDGNGTRYTTSIGEFSDGTADYFGRVASDGLSIGSFVEFTNISGGGYFAAMDIDAANAVGSGGPTSATFEIAGINISGKTNLQFSILVAEDDNGTSEHWDDNTEFIIEYQIDGGGYQSLFAVQTITDALASNNKKPYEDTDFDGSGDGAEITSVFTEFVKNITGTGNSLDIRISMNILDAGDEDIAFDNIKITGN